MNKKIIFLDLDGTLLTSDKKVSYKNVAALKEMIEAGHYVAVNSGRPINSIKGIIGEFGLDIPGVYVLGFQGNMIFENATNKILDTNCVDEDKAIELISELRKKDIYVHTYETDTIIAFSDKKNSDELARYQALTKEPAIFIDDVEELRGRQLPKILSADYVNIPRLYEFQEYFRDREGDVVESFFSAAHFLEYVKKGSNKGYGVKFLADYLNLGIGNTIACGDERNDISMIETAGVGVAMKNARQELKELADYVTENDNDHDGIAEVVYRYILI